MYAEGKLPPRYPVPAIYIEVWHFYPDGCEIVRILDFDQDPDDPYVPAHSILRKWPAA